MAKRILSLFLAVLTVLSLAVPAFAEESQDGTPEAVEDAAPATIEPAQDAEPTEVPAEPAPEPTEVPVEAMPEPTEAPAEAAPEPTEVPAEAAPEPAEVPAEPAPEPTEVPAEAAPEPTEVPAEPTPEPTEVPAEPTPGPTEVPAEATPEPTEVPAEPAPEVTEVPAEPTPEVTEVPAEPTPEPTEVPAALALPVMDGTGVPGALPVEVNTPLGGMGWSLPVLGGGVIDQNTYAGKTLLLVFCNAAGTCASSNAVVRALAGSEWNSRDDVQIVIVDGNNNDEAAVWAFQGANAPAAGHMVFALAGNDLMAKLAALYGGSVHTYAYCAVIRDGVLRFAWDNAGDAAACESALTAAAGVSAEPDPTEAPAEVVEPDPTEAPAETAEPEEAEETEGDPEPSEEPEEVPETIAAGDTINVSAEDIASLGAVKAIQKALDAAAAAGTAGAPCTVKVPAGTYNLDKGSISVGSNTILDLTGVTLTRSGVTPTGVSYNMIFLGLQKDRSPDNLPTTGATGYAFTNITIKGGTLDGSGGNTTVLKMCHAANVTVSGVALRNVDNAHLIEIAGVNGLTISGCSFSEQHLAAGSNTMTFEAIQMDVLNAEHITGYREENLATQNVTISNCTFSNVPRGVGGHTLILGCPVSGITVTGCKFSNLKSAAIFSFGWTGCNFSGNTITAPRGIVVSSISEEGGNVFAPSGYMAPAEDQAMTVSGNSITVSGTDAYSEADPVGIFAVGNEITGATGIPKGNYYVSGVRITDNTVTGTGHGISLMDAKNSTVSGNTVKNVEKNGLLAMNGSTVTAANNTITAAKGNGIWVSGSSTVTAENNTIETPVGNGIGGEQSTITATGNTVTNPGTNGLLGQDGATLNASGNTVKGAVKNGIWASGSSGVTAENNTIESPVGNGIGGEASTVKATGNTVTNPGSNGLLGTKGATLTASGNTVTAAKGNGIYVSESTLTAENNTINSPTGQGIGADGSTVTATGDAITSPGSNGLFATNGSTLTASGVTITASKGNGVYASESSTLSVSGSTVDSPFGQGIGAEKSTVTAANNTIKKAGKNAIFVSSGPKLTASGNTITSPGGAGIYASATPVTASKNKITGSVSNSIHLDGCKSSKLTGNTISGSKAMGIRIVNNSVVTVNGANKISNSATHGISVLTSKVTLSNNTISGSGNYGIVLEGATFTVSGNTVEGSATNDVRIKDSGKTKSSGSLSSNKFDGKGIFSDSAGKITESKNTITLATPKVPTVTVTPGSVKITWEKVPGAAKYRVYYKEGKGSWKKLVDTTSRTYTWKNAQGNKTYSFTVRCMTADGKSFTSGYNKTGKSVKVANLAKPVISSVSSVADGLKITWGKVTGARAYRIYYKTGSGGWKKLADTTTRTYTWTKAKSGTKYSFTVRCMTENRAGYTSSYDTKGKSISYVAVPKISKLQSTSGGVKITWAASKGASQYRLFYKTGKGDWKGLTDTTATGFTWKDAKNGTKYSFTVRCMDKKGAYVSGFDTVGKSITYKK